MDINAGVHTIDDINKKRLFFSVPDYQREYVWKADDQVEQFLADIDSEYQPTAAKQPSYFIGSIIIVKREGRYDVIDGQQRLTTIALSICALRDLLKNRELDRAQNHYLRLLEEWLTDFDPEQRKTRTRLVLQYGDSSNYLDQRINGERYNGDRTDSIQHMDDAYEGLRNHFESLLADGTANLVEFASYFLTRIELVIIESEDLSSALKIFETINQRGVGLNAMDLVKNLLFSQANEADFAKIKDTWKRLIQHLEDCRESENPLRFLRYFLMGRYHDGILREDEIYKWIISNDAKQKLGYTKTPFALAQELERLAKRYSNLVRATESFGSSTDFPHVSNIGFINKYRSRQHLVLLLALPTEVKSDVLDYLAEQIESFLFFSNVMGIQGRSNEQYFARWATEFRGARSSDEIGHVVRNHLTPYLLERLPKFRNHFLGISHRSFHPQYRERFVLGRLENTLRQLAGFSSFNEDFIQGQQVEHILPQKPKNNVLPSEFDDTETYDNAVARLGNVTLLESTINQALNHTNDLQGDWFEAKRIEYAKSNLLMTQLLDTDFRIGNDTAVNRAREQLNYKFTDWNLHSIEQRQRVLMNLAFQTWTLCGDRLDETKMPASEDSNDD